MRIFPVNIIICPAHAWRQLFRLQLRSKRIVGRETVISPALSRGLSPEDLIKHYFLKEPLAVGQQEPLPVGQQEPLPVGQQEPLAVGQQEPII